MQQLHLQNIVYRDLKVSNVFIHDLFHQAFDPVQGMISCNGMDFECSFGIVGRGYWRALKILEILQDSDVKSRFSIEKKNVYSFEMTWYEVQASCVVFEPW
jgi:hypothetical protein